MLILLFNASGAFFGGYLLMKEPSGTGLGMNVNLLTYSPFNDFFIPGLILFTAIGLVSLMGFVALLLNKESAYLFLIVEACALGGWLIVEAVMIRQLHLFQALFIVVAIILFFLGSRIRAHLVNDSI